MPVQFGNLPQAPWHVGNSMMAPWRKISRPARHQPRQAGMKMEQSQPRPALAAPSLLSLPEEEKIKEVRQFYAAC